MILSEPQWYAPDDKNVEILDLQVWPIFHAMTQYGIKVDMEKLINLRAEVDTSLKLCATLLPKGVEYSKPATVAAWMEANGFNGKRTPGGRLSTDERSLAVHHDPHLDRVLECRGLAKLLNTFIDPVFDIICKHDGIVHPHWKLTRVRSGRVACENPNLMAFPSRDPVGLKVRKCFVSRPGRAFVSVDYSQIEPRIVTAFSQDPKLLKIYREGRDLYSEIAEQLGVTRPVSKTLTLGVFYGMSAKRLHEQLKMVGVEHSVNECQDLINGWFNVFPHVRQLVDSVARYMAYGGIITTAWGRRRILPAIYLKGTRWPEEMLREEAIRQGFNHIIQGTAQEVLKQGMLEVARRHADDRCKPILQIHDEVVYEVPKLWADEWAKGLAQDMTVDRWHGVELKANGVHGMSWGDLK